ncbi:MAG: glycosyltransferase [Polyangiaceae bacterium]|jgi:ceramide glucosyltransferase|nr:glycosyltransferase [Polyangiaceae bacterium]MBK8943069.1 glycosyltransferase [Polyangiaceae bacterium]
MSALAALALALSTSWTVLGALSVAHAVRSGRSPRASAPPVTVLKPLAGADPSLEQNLRTFFEQDHAELELVFGVERADDPAAIVARRLMAAYPHVASKLVETSASQGLNPKVRNLRGMIEHARHDLVLISDSNVRAPAHYLRELATIKASDPEIGLVTNLFAGDGAGSVGARLESVQLTGFVAAGAALPTAIGDAAVIGKSMLMSRVDLDKVGGLDSVANVLAEDYVLGKKLERAGKRVVVAPTVLSNVIGPISIRTVFDRHLRWSMMRARLRPGVFALEPLTIPLFVLPLALVVLGAWAFAWLAAMWLVRDVAGWLILRGRRGLAAPALLGGARDVLALAVWVATPFKRHVAWRGHRVRVGAGTTLSLD